MSGVAQVRGNTQVTDNIEVKVIVIIMKKQRIFRKHVKTAASTMSEGHVHPGEKCATTAKIEVILLCAVEKEPIKSPK